MTQTLKFVEETPIKNKTRFGYTIEKHQKFYYCKPLLLKEFPFKWGFNNEIQFNAFDSNLSTEFNYNEWFVPNHDKMISIVEETIKNQDDFFNTIIAKLVLQDISAVSIPNDNELYPAMFITPIAPTHINSTIWGTIDYVEYAFMLRASKDGSDIRDIPF